jgi:hypothetical protein
MELVRRKREKKLVCITSLPVYLLNLIVELLPAMSEYFRAGWSNFFLPSGQEYSSVGTKGHETPSGTIFENK